MVGGETLTKLESKLDQPTKAVEQKAEAMTLEQKKQTGELFDAQKYETDKTNIIGRIKTMRLNPNFLDKTEYNNKVFLSEKTPMVKVYLAYYNGIAAKSNMIEA